VAEREGDLDFRVLGPFEVLDVGDALPIGAFRQRAVLALLVIHAREVISTDRIIDELWSGSPPPSALKTLHAYVSRLRSVLHRSAATNADSELLLTRHGGYVLDVDEAQIDSVRFERMVADAAEALQSGRPQTAADGLRDALSLWRGTALADFVYEPFAAHESQRLMERRIQAVELRVDADLALARHASVTAELEGLVGEHPTREKLWAQLMTALYRSGRQADSLAAYGRVRRLLVEQLGIEPGPELRRLERLVLEQSAELAWQPARNPEGEGVVESSRRLLADLPGAIPGKLESRPTRGTSDRLPLVGRDAHLRLLADLVRRAGPDEPAQLVTVLGEAGCGKTRLLSEFRRWAATRGVLVAAGSAERDASLPYGPFAEMVRDLVEASGVASLERVGHLRADLAWLIPELGPRPETTVDDLGLARTRLFEAVLQLFGRAGSGEPLLIFLDDAHRMGAGVGSLVRALLDRRWTRPVMVVLAIRTESGEGRTKVDESILELLRREGAVTLEVGRLTAADLTSLASQIGEDYSNLNPASLATLLGEKTAGIPLLVREVLAAGSIHKGRFAVAGSPKATVSPLVEGVIGHHLSSVSREVHRLLEVAAVVGMKFDVGALAEVTERNLLEIMELLEEALEAGILVETGELEEFAFDHGLIRDVTAGSVSAHRQVRLHAKVAEVFARRGAAVEAARHGLLGYSGISADVAAGLALRGADSALGGLDFEVARTLCSDALAGPARRADSGIRADLLLRLGRAESLLGHASEAEDAWRSAADLARSARDLDRLAEVALGTDPHGHMFTTSSDLRWALLTEAMETMGPGWTRQRLLVASEWLTEAVMPARRALTSELVFEVVDAAIALDDAYVLAAAYHARHVLARTRHFPMRRQWSDELRAVAEQIGDDKWLFHAYLACLIDTVVEADGDSMDPLLDRLRETCARYPVPRAVWTFELAAASCARLRGEFEIADEHLSAARSLGERHGIADNAAAIGAVAFVTAFHRGDLRMYRSLLDQFAASVPHVAAWTFGSGIAAAADHDLEAARSALGRGMDVIDDSPEILWLTSLCLAAELIGLVGADAPTVSRLISLLEPYSGKFAVVGTLSSEFGPTDRCLGLLSAIEGDFERAVASFRAAVAACERLGARPWELPTRVDWLVVDRMAGRPSHARREGLSAELQALGLGGAIDRLHTIGRGH
jgi:DNA-binding SARP family transcriptional activator/uncharacterized protein YqgV (UPF0045/DUF77 family)